MSFKSLNDLLLTHKLLKSVGLEVGPHPSTTEKSSPVFSGKVLLGPCPACQWREMNRIYLWAVCSKAPPDCCLFCQLTQSLLFLPALPITPSPSQHATLPGNNLLFLAAHREQFLCSQLLLPVPVIPPLTHAAWQPSSHAQSCGWANLLYQLARTL